MDFSLETIFVVFYALEWLIRVIMIFVVPRNRNPSSASAWLLLIMLQPTLGTIFFAIFGSPKLPRIRRARQASVDEMTKTELSKLLSSKKSLFEVPHNDDHATIANLANFLGGLPAMGNNTVSLFTDYDKALKVQVDAINNAKDFVHIEYFIVAMDDATEEFFVALESAVKRGVTVRLLFDSLACKVYPNYKKMKRRLDQIGVYWQEMLPINLIPGKNFTRPDLRNHRKIVVVDGKIGFTGSLNMIQKNYHRKDDLYYEEIMVKVSGPVVWQLNNVFRADWYAETDEPLNDLVESVDVIPSQGKVIAQVLPSGPSHEYDNNLKLYASMIHSAKKEVFIVVPYFVPDESLMTAITSAVQRGVKVTMINSEIIDKLLVGHAQRSFYEELLKVGVKIYLYKKPVFLHTKHVSIDSDAVILGSSNLDIRSFELDLEVSIVLYDKQIVSNMRKIESVYLQRSTEVHLKEWQARPLKLKLLDQLSRLTAALQ